MTRGVLALALAAGLAACATAGRAAPVQRDSLVGHLQIVGTDALPRTVLVPDDGTLSVTLVGPPALRRLGGLGVEIEGTRAGSQFTVQRFTVVSANGLEATDGRLVDDGGTLSIVTADGVRHALVRPSSNLRAHVGGRVWVSGPLDREPVAYGIIE